MASSSIKKDTEWKSLLAIRQVEVDNVSVPANSFANVNFSIPSVSGYKPFLAIYRNNRSSNAIFPVDASSIMLDENSSSFTLTVRNVGSAITTLVRANIIYTKR